MPRQHIASPSDCIDSIAYTYGLLPDTIWQDPANDDLRTVRPDRNVLMPGDVITIPDKRVHEIARATELRHRFLRKAVPARIAFRVLRLGEAVANTAWRAVIDERETLEGQTDGDGLISLGIRPNALQAVLTVETTPEPLVYQLDLGAMMPVETIEGVQQRLINLAYSIPDEEFGAPLERTRRALQRFQRDRDLPVTGEPDDATRAALADATRRV